MLIGDVERYGFHIVRVGWSKDDRAAFEVGRAHRALESFGEGRQPPTAPSAPPPSFGSTRPRSQQ